MPFLKLHKSGLITLHAKEGHRLSVIGHKDTPNGVAAMTQTTIPFK